MVLLFIWKRYPSKLFPFSKVCVLHVSSTFMMSTIVVCLSAELTGHKIESFIVWNFEYGKNYSGPG